MYDETTAGEGKDLLWPDYYYCFIVFAFILQPTLAGEEKGRHPDQMFPRVLLWLSSNQVRELSLHVFLCDRMHSDNSFLSFLFFFWLDMRQDRGSVRNVMLLLEHQTITGGWAAISWVFPNVFSYQYLLATCVLLCQLFVTCRSCPSCEILYMLFFIRLATFSIVFAERC